MPQPDPTPFEKRERQFTAVVSVPKLGIDAERAKYKKVQKKGGRKKG